MLDEYSTDTHLAILVGKRSGQKYVGAAVKRSIGLQQILELFEFCDNDQFSNLDALLVQIGNGTIYLPDDISSTSKHEYRKLMSVLNRTSFSVNLVKRSSHFRKSEVMHSMIKLVGDKSHEIVVAETDREFSYPALDCLILKLNLLADSESYNTFDFKLSCLDSFMKLDSSAVEAINLLPKVDDPSQYGSIYGLLNKCRTKMGSRLLERWLRQPLINYSDINRRLDIVEVLKNSPVLRNKLIDGPLKGIPDLDFIIERMQRKNAGLNEVYRLYLFCKSIPSFISIVSELAEASLKEEISFLLRESYLDPLEKLSEKFSKYIQLIEHVIDFNQLPDLLINSAHSTELQDLKDEIDDLENQANELWEDAREDWASFTDVKLERNPQHGFIFRTPKGDDERQLRANNKNVVILSLQKNGVHFTTNKLQGVADRMKSVEVEYKFKQTELVSQAVETALTYLPVAEKASSLIAELDVLTSFATVAAVAPIEYVRPTFHPMGSGVLKLIGARHPCVELMDSIDFIANDYNLVRDESNFQIITGPNMGGKSTFIRGVGCIVVMAHVGSFVPCESAELSVIDCILARVGAGDAVQKGVSTFMAEMLEASVILKTATKDSLIIIDELGRGTSTFDGFGIAWAISDYIVNKIDCFCLFATHFHELTSLAQQYKSVKNKHVSAITQNKEVIMLYNVLEGACTESFGINVAEMAGFPPNVITEAKRKIIELDTVGNPVNSEKSIAELKRAKTAMDTFKTFPISSIKLDTFHEEMKTIFSADIHNEQP